MIFTSMAHARSEILECAKKAEAATKYINGLRNKDCGCMLCMSPDGVSLGNLQACKINGSEYAICRHCILVAKRIATGEKMIINMPYKYWGISADQLIGELGEVGIATLLSHRLVSASRRVRNLQEAA